MIGLSIHARISLLFELDITYNYASHSRLIERADEHGFCIGFDATRDEEATRCGPNCTAVEHMRFL